MRSQREIIEGLCEVIHSSGGPDTPESQEYMDRHRDNADVVLHGELTRALARAVRGDDPPKRKAVKRKRKA